jgi:hypothetical protein
MNGRPNTLAEVAERRQAGEDFGRLLSEFLDQFYPALASTLLSLARSSVHLPLLSQDRHCQLRSSLESKILRITWHA